MITEDRIRYYEKLILDYTEFLSRPHKPTFYTDILYTTITAKKVVINWTNEAHILFLLKDAREQLGIDE